MTDSLYVNKRRLAKAKKSVPESDFVSANYDIKTPVEAKGLILILSTPRSGSTLLCEYLRKAEFCLAHEYFQRAEYLPILADRWSCLNDSLLNKQKYVEQLYRFRTLDSGWLGINLHGHHIPVFKRFIEYFSFDNLRVVHVRRKSILKQSISYEIARQTKRWSSEYNSKVEPIYDFDKIKERITELSLQEIVNEKFCDELPVRPIEVYYEDLLTRKLDILSNIVGDFDLGFDEGLSTLKRQSSEINSNWEARFYEDCLVSKKNKRFICF